MTNLAETIQGKYALSEMIVKSTNRVDETEGSLKGKSMRTISK